MLAALSASISMVFDTQTPPRYSGKNTVLLPERSSNVYGRSAMKGFYLVSAIN